MGNLGSLRPAAPPGKCIAQQKCRWWRLEPSIPIGWPFEVGGIRYRRAERLYKYARIRSQRGVFTPNNIDAVFAPLASLGLWEGSSTWADNTLDTNGSAIVQLTDQQTTAFVGGAVPRSTLSATPQI